LQWRAANPAATWWGAPSRDDATKNPVGNEAFDLAVDGVGLSELRASIRRGDRLQSEVWLYRWTP
jgi:hypothetical protein